MSIALVIAAMLALYLFASKWLHPHGACPVCGGQDRHHQTCPQRDRDE